MNDFKWMGKTLLVVVPHEDDEINLAGSVIYKTVLQGIKVICVFITNGDWFYPAQIRMKEAIHSLKTIGVNKEDIIFLGYPDSGEEIERSIFKSAQIDSNGHKSTYGSKECLDFATIEYGHAQTYTWENVLSDLKCVILKYRPTTIIGTDFDNHADHRMSSIALDKAMGEILNQKRNDYFPIYLKGFAYSVAFQGEDDLFDKHFRSSKINRKALRYPEFGTDNPAFEWKNRIRFPVEEDCRTIHMKRNIIFKALCCHESQKILARASRIINGDQVFWQKRTDNLIHQGKVTVSSGNGNFLCDFQTMDVKNVCVTKPDFEEYCWIPRDEMKWCRCTFAKERHIEEISFWGNIDTNSQILKGKLIFSNGYSYDVNSILPHGRETQIKIVPQDHVKWVEFRILEWEGNEPGLAEWGIYAGKNQLIPVLKILCDGEFAYCWNVWKGEHTPKITAYMNGNISGLRWFINGNMLKSSEDVLTGCEKTRTHARIRVEAVNDSSLYDEVDIFYSSDFAKVKFLLSCYYNKWLIKWNKIKRAKRHHQLKKAVKMGLYNE